MKVGPASSGGGSVSGVTIRYNTMDNNLGPSNVQLAWGTSDVQIFANIMSRPQPGREAVATFQLSGSGNVVRDNVYWLAAGPAPATSGVTVVGNVEMDPEFVDVGTEEMRLATRSWQPRTGTTAGGTAGQDPRTVPVTVWDGRGCEVRTLGPRCRPTSVAVDSVRVACRTSGSGSGGVSPVIRAPAEATRAGALS